MSLENQDCILENSGFWQCDSKVGIYIYDGFVCVCKLDIRMELFDRSLLLCLYITIFGDTNNEILFSSVYPIYLKYLIN